MGNIFRLIYRKKYFVSFIYFLDSSKYGFSNACTTIARFEKINMNASLLKLIEESLKAKYGYSSISIISFAEIEMEKDDYNVRPQAEKEIA